MCVWRSVVVAGAAALVLSACASKPEIPFDRATAGAIKTIAVVPPAMPDDGSVVLASTVGQSFGLVGALVDAGMAANRDSHFKDLLK